ncbi:hypothetical protein ACH5RR_019788 [Cinchona calisaya]|uniref:Uncharacterized protein n=1 Tax=Cinchona calisaya TaxID=153742 RepID=A0ABD2ZQD4_9GENT
MGQAIHSLQTFKAVHDPLMLQLPSCGARKREGEEKVTSVAFTRFFQPKGDGTIDGRWRTTNIVRQSHSPKSKPGLGSPECTWRYPWSQSTNQPKKLAQIGGLVLYVAMWL